MPKHVAIIMDGNRRWASARGLPKAVGHGAGSRRVRAIVQACAERGISHLTLFAFSTENWRRPMDEVGSLIGLLTLYLQKELATSTPKAFACAWWVTSVPLTNGYKP